nr:GspH/FimT family pseudopilin [Schlegelella koreensis]
MKTAPLRGFTLVELLVGISLIGILLALGAPSLATYLQNSKVANAASTFYSGVQLARTEAIRRNAPAHFVMSDTVPTSDAAASSAAPSITGRHWFVRAASGADFELIEAKSGNEGGGSGTNPAVQVSGGVIGAGSFDGVIAFNGFGATVDGTGYVISIANPNGGACAPSGPIRCREIRVLPGGQIMACDPAASAVPGDTRGC